MDYKHINTKERELIYLLFEHDIFYTSFENVLDRDKSSISMEIKKNIDKDNL